MATGKLTYKDAGVDIDAKDGLVERIKPLARLATRPEVVAGVGGFAGLIGIPAKYREPLLVSGSDGVGTKLKSAFATGRHDTVGIDLVAMSVNDVLVTGAEPLFFLDYVAVGKLDVDVAEAIVKGVADGCRQAGCALLGGETAELPGFYRPGEYDLAGFCVGVVERGDVRDGRGLAAGDALIGIPSSGLHSNGHSLARKILLEVYGHAFDDRPDALAGASVADVLLAPTRIYTPAFRALAAVRWKGAAHITGGGLVHNPPRFVPEGAGLALRFRTRSWPVPAVFRYLQAAGVDDEEMRTTFNMGLGMVVAVAPGDAGAAVAALGGDAHVVGEVVPRTGPETEFGS